MRFWINIYRVTEINSPQKEKEKEKEKLSWIMVDDICTSLQRHIGTLFMCFIIIFLMRRCRYPPIFFTQKEKKKTKTIRTVILMLNMGTIQNKRSTSI